MLLVLIIPSLEHSQPFSSLPEIYMLQILVNSCSPPQLFFGHSTQIYFNLYKLTEAALSSFILLSSCFLRGGQKQPSIWEHLLPPNSSRFALVGAGKQKPGNEVSLLGSLVQQVFMRHWTVMKIKPRLVHANCSLPRASPPVCCVSSVAVLAWGLPCRLACRGRQQRFPEFQPKFGLSSWEEGSTL